MAWRWGKLAARPCRRIIRIVRDTVPERIRVRLRQVDHGEQRLGAAHKGATSLGLPCRPQHNHAVSLGRARRSASGPGRRLAHRVWVGAYPAPANRLRRVLKLGGRAGCPSERPQARAGGLLGLQGLPEPSSPGARQRASKKPTGHAEPACRCCGGDSPGPGWIRHRATVQVGQSRNISLPASKVGVGRLLVSTPCRRVFARSWPLPVARRLSTVYSGTSFPSHPE